MKTRKLALPKGKKEKRKKKKGCAVAWGRRVLCQRHIFQIFVIHVSSPYFFISNYHPSFHSFSSLTRRYCIVKNNQNLMKRCI